MLKTTRLALFSVTILALLAAACGGQVTTTGNGGSAGNGAAGNGAAGNGDGGSAGSTGTPTEDFTSCTADTQCVLAVPSCCQPCTSEDLSLFVAIDGSKADAYHKSVCPVETPCPACDPMMNPNFVAYCDAGKCVAADVRTHPVSACKDSADCALRNGSSCCETCEENPYQLIAVSLAASPTLGDLVCIGDVSCPKCQPLYPPNTEASCSMSGHCQVITK